MDQKIWLKTEEKVSSFLVLRGTELHRLRLTGNAFTLKKKTAGVVEALEGGAGLAESGASLVGSIDARSIALAELSPGGESLTFRGEGEKGPRLSYNAPKGSGGEILRAVLDRSGRPFAPAQEAIGAVEALIPPAITGLFAGLLWLGIYGAATELDAGKVVEVTGRRAGLKQLMFVIAANLGTGGTLALGGLLLAAVVGWGVLLIVRRPERTVWTPAPA